MWSDFHSTQKEVKSVKCETNYYKPVIKIDSTDNSVFGDTKSTINDKERECNTSNWKQVLQNNH